MSYTPTQWQTGDTITAEALNNMESGIEEASFAPYEYERRIDAAVTIDSQTGELSVTVSVPITGQMIIDLMSGELNLRCGVGTDSYVNMKCVGNVLSVLYFVGEYIDLASNGVKSFYVLLGENVAAAGWLPRVTEPFIVTLTPAAADFSGTMDKTVAEINAAYQAGYKIIFRVGTSATDYMDVDCTYRVYDGSAYPSFNASLVTNSPIDAFVYIYTSTTSDGTQDTYCTTIYPLTPMS